MEKKTIGGFIAALRKANGLTQKQLAEKLNVSDKAVSRWERDEAMPDLSLIPELADIFGVTTDEILRGERRNPEVIAPFSGDRSEKQRKRLLADRKNKYRIRSTVAIGLSVLGLIGAKICNFGFLRAYLGFMVGCVFYVVAVICQIGFIITNLAGLDSEMVTEEELVTHREHTVKLACGSFGTTLVLLFTSLPLVIFPWDAYQGLEVGSWLAYGLLSGLVGFLLYLVAASTVKFNLTKQGLIYANERDCARQTLKTRFVRIGILVIIGLFVGQLCVLSFLPDLLTKNMLFDDWNSFKAFMETTVTEEEYIQYGFGGTIVDVVPIEGSFSESGEYYDEFGHPTDETPEQVLDENGNVICEFYHRNQTVSSWSFTLGDPKDTKIKVCTTAEIIRVNSLMENIITPAYCMLYPLALIILFLFYRRKAKLL